MDPVPVPAGLVPAPVVPGSIGRPIAPEILCAVRLAAFRRLQAERDDHAPRCFAPGQCLVLWAADERLRSLWAEILFLGADLADLYDDGSLVEGPGRLVSAGAYYCHMCGSPARPGSVQPATADGFATGVCSGEHQYGPQDKRERLNVPVKPQRRIGMFWSAAPPRPSPAPDPRAARDGAPASLWGER